MADVFCPLFVEVDVERIKAEERGRRDGTMTIDRIAAALNRLSVQHADLLRDLHRMMGARLDRL